MQLSVITYHQCIFSIIISFANFISIMRSINLVFKYIFAIFVYDLLQIYLSYTIVTKIII